VVTFDFLLEQWIGFLNIRTWQPRPPEPLSDFYSEEQYVKSRDYHKANYRVDLLSETIGFAFMIILLISGAFGALDKWLSQFISQPIWLALAFFGILMLASSILSMPFSLYKTFVIEEKFGFNKSTMKTWIADRLKGLLLGVILGGLVGYALLWLMLRLHEDFWLYAWLFTSILVIGLNLFYTSLFLPLFNKMKPLEEGGLRTAIETYARKVDFPLNKIMVMDGSKRSSKANAFFSGMGRSKKIVLFDTLIEKHPNEELVAVLAHEAGHYKKHHILKGMVLSLVQIALMYWLLSLFLFEPKLSEALGAGQFRIHLNLLALGILFGPFSLITGIAMNLFSRKNEFEADAYAIGTANASAFRQALIRLSTHNLSNLHPHPAYVFIHYSHPPLLSRLSRIGK
jgi:STE24 endopeptidase